MITMSSAGGGSSSGSDDMINNLADKILGELPPFFDVAAAEKKFPIRREQSMNTVLT